jgi:sugar phosphate isomerase/epimerase
VNTAINGCLDTKPYTEIPKRSWTFRTVGYGHDELWWREFMTALRVAGYDGPISIEHEDALMSMEEGFTKAVELLKKVIYVEPPPKVWWA